MVYLRRLIRQPDLSLLIVPFFLLVNGQNGSQEPQHPPDKNIAASTVTEPNTCSDIELNHSNLVECNDSGCKTDDILPVWPSETQAGVNADIVHVHSSRSGDRFAVDHLKDLNYVETLEERNFDINTTLNVKDQAVQKIEGFGTTLNLYNLALLSPKFQRNILSDLFSESRLGLTLLRININREAILNGTLAYYISKLAERYPEKDDLQSKRATKLVIFVDDLAGSQEELESLNILETISYGPNLELLAVVLERGELLESELKMMRDVFSRNSVYVSASAMDPSEIYLELEKNEIYNGLALKWGNRIPYNTINAFRKVMKDNHIFTIASESSSLTCEPGDWQNAQDYAVQILNHLKHSSNGFIDNPSFVNLFSNVEFQDRPIYSLQENDGLYFRGPMYYALGHFSRYITPGSKLLETSIETQPNMFAAQYGAFRTPDNHIVVIVLNYNEHLLPFRVRLWNAKVVTLVDLKPKSFNTIVIKP